LNPLNNGDIPSVIKCKQTADTKTIRDDNACWPARCHRQQLMSWRTKMARNFKHDLYMEKKISVWCADSNFILFELSRPQFWNRHNFFFYYHKKKIKLCVVSTTLNFFFLKKLHSLSSEDQANQNFFKIYMKKGSMCQQDLRIWYKKNWESHIWTGIY
jgi:hypothetical protein